jgi:hypothetical protein
MHWYFQKAIIFLGSFDIPDLRLLPLQLFYQQLDLPLKRTSNTALLPLSTQVSLAQTHLDLRSLKRTVQLQIHRTHQVHPLLLQTDLLQ